jgi:MFS family permease
MSDARSKAESDSEAFVSWREFLGSSYASSLGLVCLAVWLHAADSLLVATMLPSIVAGIGGAPLVGWSVSLYEIGSIVAGVASALLSMRFGLRGPMGLAAVLFGAGCILSAVAPIMPILLAGRALQGIGGGGLVALGFVAVGTLFPRRYTARAMAAISTFWGVSAFLGPLIGGIFVELATWRWGFAFFAMQALVLAFWILLRPEPGELKETPAAAAFPLGRLTLLCLSVVLIGAGGVEIEAVQTAAFVCSGVICFAVFLAFDGRAPETRLLPLRPFDPRRPGGAALLMILSLSMATIAITAFGPLLITAIHDASALTAGYVLACSSVGWTFTAVLVSGSPERLDRLMIAIGISAVAFSIVGFLYAVSNGPVWLIAVCAATEGGGFGVAWTFILRQATRTADAREVQRISGAIPTTQRLGYALGAAYIGIVANASGLLTMKTPSEASEVARMVFLACLPFASIGLYAMTRLVKRQ